MGMSHPVTCGRLIKTQKHMGLSYCQIVTVKQQSLNIRKRGFGFKITLKNHLFSLLCTKIEVSTNTPPPKKKKVI